MRGSEERTGSLFSFVDLEERVPRRHPLRKIRQIVNDALVALDADFSKLHASEGRPSIAPEKLAPRCCRLSSRYAPSGS
jgi:transposase